MPWHRDTGHKDSTLQGKRSWGNSRAFPVLDFPSAKQEELQAWLCWQLVAVPSSLLVPCVEWGRGEAGKGVPGPTPGNFCSSQALPMSQNRLTIHSCLFAERTRAQSVLNS